MPTKGETGETGERGPTGDSGERGAEGERGLTGVIGPIGVIGERGRTGDHGQPGAAGAVGDTGLTGETGAAGKNARNILRPLLAIFIVVVVGGVGLGWVVQENAEKTRSLEVSQNRDDCMANVLTQIVESNAEATSLSAQTSNALRQYVAAAVDGKIALADAFTLILTEDVTDEQAIAALQDATDRIRQASVVGAAYDELSEALAKARREHPTPVVADVEACR